MWNKFRTNIAILGCAVTGASNIAQATEAPHVYAGVVYQRMDVNANPDIKFDSVLLRVGYRLSSYFGVEGELGTAINSDTLNINGTKVKYKAGFSAGAFGVGFIPLSDNFDLIGRVGYKYMNIEAKTPGFKSSIDADGFAWSVGAQYHFTPAHGVRVDYEKSGSDGATYSLGYTVRF